MLVEAEFISNFGLRPLPISGPWVYPYTMDLNQPLPWLLLLLTVAVVFLIRGRGYHESADKVVRDCCRQNGLQLLDGTVSFHGFSLLWERVSLTRTYRFEYSLNGVDRYQGLVTLSGNQAIALRIDPEHLAAKTIY